MGIILAAPLAIMQFGGGTGPIDYDEVACTGLEERLEDCPRLTEQHNCQHTEDAGIACSCEDTEC